LVMLSDYPRNETLRERMYFFWSKYIFWGTQNPSKRKVMGQLSVSDRITAESKLAATSIFSEAQGLLDECIKNSQLQHVSCAFVSSMMIALADTTMDFILREPLEIEQYCATGFDAFWRALGCD
jgi:hypothetical protein